MSITLMSSTWKMDIPSGRKMVLLALCDCSNDMGECYPSIPMVARKCSMSERTVQTHISDLVRQGYVKRTERKGRSTLYLIDLSEKDGCVGGGKPNPRNICTPANSAPPQNFHPTPAESAPPPPQNFHPTPANSAPITISEPSSEPSGEPSINKPREKTRKSVSAPDQFDPLEFLMSRGIDRQVASDWLAVRREKKLLPTKTALDGVMAEAEGAGISPSDALLMCCLKGWGGFKASWYRNELARDLPAAHAQATPPAHVVAGKTPDVATFNAHENQKVLQSLGLNNGDVIDV